MMSDEINKKNILKYKRIVTWSSVPIMKNEDINVEWNSLKILKIVGECHSCIFLKNFVAMVFICDLRMTIQIC